MRFDVLTLFPEMIDSYCKQSILAIAQKKQIIEVVSHNPRDYSKNKAKSVDDVVYGGGAGMLLSPEPFIDCLSGVIEKHSSSGLQAKFKQAFTKLDELKHDEIRDYEIIVTSPGGRRLDQELARELAQKKQLIILCGRYEGLDARIQATASLEVSLGDFVLTGGELAALSIIDSSSRLIPGVLGDEDSAILESFSSYNYLAELKRLGTSKKELAELTETTQIPLAKFEKLKLLEAAQFTRPFNFQGLEVPQVLSSGDHKKIFLWRLKQAIKLTRQRRPDLLE